MKKHSDYITHIKNPEDLIYLRDVHFPVNMRLFNTSSDYRELIRQHCQYIKMLCLTQMDGYKKPHGMSSANAGLGFNIIGITMKRETKSEWCKIMINPVIITYHGVKTLTITNCGSLTLNKPIQVYRYPEITVQYFNELGEFIEERIDRDHGAFTVQHEVDHNLGILIIDK